MIAARSIVVMGAETDSCEAIDKVAGRPRIPRRCGAFRRDQNARRWPHFWYVPDGVAFPISMLGGWLCWRWASLLYTQSGGMLARAARRVSPNVLAHGQLATVSMSGAVLALLSHAFCSGDGLGKRTRVRRDSAALALALVCSGRRRICISSRISALPWCDNNRF